jgi:hypothetical protein
MVELLDVRVDTVFKSAGPRLIDPAGWPVRAEEDRQWQSQLVKWLWPKSGCRHIKRVLPGIGRARIRPEESTGAGLEDELPARFEQCEPNGKAILGLNGGHLSLPPRFPSIRASSPE